MDISNPNDALEVSFLSGATGTFGVSMSVEHYENFTYVAMVFGGEQILMFLKWSNLLLWATERFEMLQQTRALRSEM